MANLKQLPVIYKIAAFILLLMLSGAIFAPVIAPYDPNQVLPDETLQSCSGAHLLGTDALGRDVFSRILYGARVSISFAVAAALCTMFFGVTLGMISGYFGGIIDTIIQLLVNIFQGLPGMSMMIAIAGVMGPSTASLLLAVTLTSWAGFSRIVRGEVLKIREENYIDFLGLGMQPPEADWGVMINDAKIYFRSYPNLLLAPGLCILALCASINLIGDALRDLFSIQQDITKQYL
ncbi:MAG: ABC-type transporter, integral rane subunit [Firmicutes bacterium]|nr:ABC-type transporter, integral rane subunit [Bacillota bacterium]